MSAGRAEEVRRTPPGTAEGSGSAPPGRDDRPVGGTAGLRDLPVASRRLTRRLDWRFLLDDPRLGRVAYGGPDAGALRPALRRDADAVRILPAGSGAAGVDSRGGPGEDGVDLAVLHQPDRAALRAARDALRAGGRLYCEVDRAAGLAALLPGRGRRRATAPARALLLGDAAGLLRELGFVDVRGHVHHPSFEACREIVPMEPAALALGLRRHAGWLPDGLLRLAGSVGARLLPRLAPLVSFVARRPPGDGGPTAEPQEMGPREARRGTGSGERPGAARQEAGPGKGQESGPEGEARPWTEGARLAVTPRFRASGHVVILVPDAAGSRAERVVKIARRADRSGPLAREAKNLRRVHAVRSGGFPSIPRLEGTGRIGGAPFLVETGLRGRPLDRSFVRRRPGLGVRSVVDWLVELHGATARREGTPGGRYRRLLAEPLARFARCFPLEREERRLVEDTLRLTRPLARRPWPTVFEHGDLSHPNLLLHPDDGVGVVDWELAEPEGLPAADLFFFLAYVAFARFRAKDAEACLRAFDWTFFRRSRRVERAVGRYVRALGLPPGLLPSLFLATWPRQVIRQLDRVTPALRDGLDAATVDWLRGHRFFALWRHAVESADRLWLAPGPDP